jgi:hypothetical protein
MFYTKVVEKKKTLILYSEIFSRKSCCYEIISKDMVGPEGPQMTSQYGASRCMLDKQGYTPACMNMLRAQAPARTRAPQHRKICNTYCFSTATIQERVSMLGYKYTVCLV